MDAKPPRVQLVGLLPAIMTPCGPSCAAPFTHGTVSALQQEELAETPPALAANADRAHTIAEQLFRDFGDRIRLEVVGLDTPRGIWIGMRHRVAKGFAVVVDGKQVVRNPTDYGPVRTMVERAFESRRQPA